MAVHPGNEVNMKKILRFVIPILLMLVMTLPLTAFADDPIITGYAYDYDSTLSQHGGYRSRWVGSELATSASYANWVRADGQFQGPLQWSPAIKSDVTLDNETGVLTFNGVSDNGNIQINPVENGKLKAGVSPLFIAFDTKPETDKFAGMVITAFENKSDRTLCWIDLDGQVYWGTTVSAGGTKVSTGKSLVMNEWNTVMLYMIPQFAEDDATQLTGYTAYVNVLPTSQCVKGWGITEADMKSFSPAFNWSATKIFTDNGSKGLIKGYQANEIKTDKNSPKLYFNLRDFRVFRMKEDQPLYKVAFEGFPDLTAYVPQSSNNDTSVITAPSATGVSYWVNGEGTSAEFLTPGDAKKIVASTVYGVASGTQLEIASLMAAVTRLNADALAAGSYTYVEMKSSYDEIDERLTATLSSGTVSDQVGGTNYDYYLSATERMNDLFGKMETIEANAEMLIANAAIFADDTADLDERITAYEEVKDLPIDETYSDECRAAKTDLDIFTATYLEISVPYQTYKDNKGRLLVDHTDDEWRELLLLLVNNITTIKDSGATFEPDRVFFTKYEAYLVSQTARIKATKTITQKYHELDKLVDLYNAYNTGIGKSKTVAPAVQEAIDDYNSSIARLNAEIITAAKIATSCSLEVTQNTAFGKFIAYVTKAVDQSTPLPTKSEEN